MKSALFFTATLFSIILSVLATPTTSRSGVSHIVAPAGFKPSDVNELESSVKEQSHAAAHYWVCIAVSESTLQYGWSRGGSEGSALNGAKSRCGRNDCNFYSCAEEGCVGIDYGSSSASLSYAIGYGPNDGNKAESKALSGCRKHDHGCKRPGHFCAARIV